MGMTRTLFLTSMCKDLGRGGEFAFEEFVDRAIQAKFYMVEIRLAESFDSPEFADDELVSRDDVKELIGNSYEALKVDDVFAVMDNGAKVHFQYFLHQFDLHIEALRQSMRSKRRQPAVVDGGDHDNRHSRLFSFRMPSIRRSRS